MGVRNNRDSDIRKRLRECQHRGACVEKYRVGFRKQGRRLFGDFLFCGAVFAQPFLEGEFRRTLFDSEGSAVRAYELVFGVEGFEVAADCFVRHFKVFCEFYGS